VQHPLEILFEDAHCLALAKPAGQFTLGRWAPPGERSLEDRVREYLNPAHPASVYLGIVHRLDRPTSGVLLWAKTRKAARRLSRQFERQQAIKEYWAVVEVHAAISGDAILNSSNSGDTRLNSSDDSADTIFDEVWSDWLTGAHPSGRVRVVAPRTAGARAAVTRVRCASLTAGPPGCAWLRLWPYSGRTHQLRAQSSARGMPILGDVTYGARLSFTPPEAIALHAKELRVRHPILDTELTLVAPLPSEWSRHGIVVTNPDDR
jgi:23S rRNA pseudouridine1911/1915/1917 synthase